MPIVSRRLVQLSARPDLGPGKARWRMDATTASGLTYSCSWAGALTEEEATALMEAAFPEEELKVFESERALAQVEDGEVDPLGYTPEDMTVQEWRRALLRRFFKADFKSDGRFLKRAAPFVANLTVAQITNLIPMPPHWAQRGIDRAIKIRDVLVPAMDDVDDGIEEI